MRFRARVKRFLFGFVPFFRGRFPYFGHIVYFPLGSHIFARACEDRIYERETLNLILSLAKPGTTYIDVGANIGLLSVPVLASRLDIKIVSIEASPDTLPHLLKTHAASPRRCDWTVVNAAVGDATGETEFFSAAGGAQGAYDGIRDTKRGGPKRIVRVALRTLDDIWRDIGSPLVSIIKMDIEGGEIFALQGARNCLAKTQPILVIEWAAVNLTAYDVKPTALLQLCADLGYRVYAFPSLARVDSESVLRLAMAQTVTFVLVPIGSAIAEAHTCMNSTDVEKRE